MGELVSLGNETAFEQETAFGHPFWRVIVTEQVLLLPVAWMRVMYVRCRMYRPGRTIILVWENLDETESR